MPDVGSGITAGPDGAIWFTGYSSIGRISPSGVVRTIQVNGGSPWGMITTGPDGALWFTGGVATMTLGFFLWLGLMSQYDLSYLYPFEGLHYILIVLAAAVFLKEKASLSLWLGVALISAGVVIVSAN